MAVSGCKESDFSQVMFIAETPHFIKIILQDCLPYEKLKIPDKFWHKFGSGIRSSIKLLVPCGAVRKVGVTKSDCEGWLQNGWREFAEHYSLSHGHLIVFRYDGDENFHVFIFDMTATEIDYPLVGSNGEACDPREEGNKERPYRKRREKSPLPRSKPSKSIKTNSTSAEVRDCHGGLFGDHHIFQQEKVPNRVEPLAADEKSEALQKAIAFKSNNPFFLIVMQPSYINSAHALDIPAWFIKKYLPEKHGEVMLQILDGRGWTVGYKIVVQNHKTYGRFYGKWKAFAEDNNLEVGDVCVFELINGIQLLFQVIIYQNDDNPNCLRSQRMSTTTTKCLKSEDNQSVQPSTPNKIACQRAPASNSKNPFFLIVMKPCYVNPKKSNSRIPKDFAEKHLKGSKGEVHLRTQDGSWDVQYTVHVTCGRFRAHFDSRWRAFVQGNNLKVGDACFFELIQGPKTSFNVVIKRAIEDANHGSTTKYGGECRKLRMETGMGTTEKHSPQATASGRKFGSKYPFFTVVISPCYLKRHSARIPTGFAKEHIKKHNTWVTLESAGRSWEVKVLNYGGKFKLSAGWGAFARENCLQQGDACAFELMKRRDIVLKVSIFRRSSI